MILFAHGGTAMGENKRKNLEFIQAIISRMAGNLFFLKGWAITLITGLFALAVKGANAKYFALAFGVAVVLWAVDGYWSAGLEMYQ